MTEEQKQVIKDRWYQKVLKMPMVNPRSLRYNIMPDIDKSGYIPTETFITPEPPSDE